MAYRDLHNNIHVVPGLVAQAIAINTTVNGPIIDTQPYGSIEFAIQAAAITDGTYTPSLTEGDDPALAGGNAVAASDMLGTVAAATHTVASAGTTKKIGYKGTRRYVRLSLTSTGVTTGGNLAAVAVQGHPRNAPAA